MEEEELVPVGALELEERGVDEEGPPGGGNGLEPRECGRVHVEAPQ